MPRRAARPSFSESSYVVLRIYHEEVLEVPFVVVSFDVSNKLSDVLNDIPEWLFHCFGRLDELAQCLLRLELVVLVRIPLQGIFRIRDSLQGGVPVVPVGKATEKNETLVAVVGADAFYQVWEEGLVKRDDPRL